MFISNLQKVVTNKRIMLMIAAAIIALIAAFIIIFLYFMWSVLSMIGELFLWVAAVFYVRSFLRACRVRNQEDATRFFGIVLVIVSIALYSHIAFWKSCLLLSVGVVAILAAWMIGKRKRRGQ